MPTGERLESVGERLVPTGERLESVGERLVPTIAATQKNVNWSDIFCIYSVSPIHCHYFLSNLIWGDRPFKGTVLQKTKSVPI